MLYLNALVVHFRRRIGDQDFNLTDEKIDLLEKPVRSLSNVPKFSIRITYFPRPFSFN
jgi:hypothetical protein